MIDYVLIKTDTGIFLGTGTESQTIATPAGKGMAWVKWGKEIPDEIQNAEPGTVVYKDGELIKE